MKVVISLLDMVKVKLAINLVNEFFGGTPASNEKSIRLLLADPIGMKGMKIAANRLDDFLRPLFNAEITISVEESNP